MARITVAKRKSLPKSDFAIPSKATGKNKSKSGNYPVDTPGRAKAALGLVGMHGTPAQKAQVRAKVHGKYPNIGKKSKRK